VPAFVTFDASASREYLRAVRWYAAHADEQTAAAFTAEVNRAVVRIEGDPNTGTEFRKRYRWVRLWRFPYLIYYRVVSDAVVLVLAVAHERRRPGYWSRRDK
jgi:toxin ParE1/3/4